jgi:hypothetical protein
MVDDYLEVYRAVLDAGGQSAVAPR